ncbi:winged helix-turn-helix transcriptional regulator [Candidatus Bathyarchaeota archaeon]|nr:winged helix-turn-helix transcriptional regulator [Candidatus Bathyarchaeota archaeon]
MRGRPKESGHKNQLYILLVLREYGELYGQEIVDKTGLKREEVWRNLKVLVRKDIIEKEKKGRKVFYKPSVNKNTLEHIITILYEGGLNQLQKKAAKQLRLMKRHYQQFSKLAKQAETYESEIVELAASGEKPYAEILPHAKSWRETKKSMKRSGLPPSVSVPSSKMREVRQTLTHPRKIETKDVITSNGIAWRIRKPTLLEIIDMMKDVEASIDKQKKEQETDSDLREAVERLLS